ncbi:MAG: hypothetical protein JXA09_15695 [Anaerolineae bacterium]|nr:hypothetical protein [Anaerolineae bacterium]
MRLRPSSCPHPWFTRSSVGGFFGGELRRAGYDGIVITGDIEGPSIEYHLFAATSGVDWSEETFWQAAERVCTLARALQVRHWARFRPVVDAFYHLHGWDVERGWPTLARMDALGLGDLYPERVAGALRAKAEPDSAP